MKRRKFLGIASKAALVAAIPAGVIAGIPWESPERFKDVDLAYPYTDHSGYLLNDGQKRLCRELGITENQFGSFLNSFNDEYENRYKTQIMLKMMRNVT